MVRKAACSLPTSSTAVRAAVTMSGLLFKGYSSSYFPNHAFSLDAGALTVFHAHPRAIRQPGVAGLTQSGRAPRLVGGCGEISRPVPIATQGDSAFLAGHA